MVIIIIFGITKSNILDEQKVFETLIQEMIAPEDARLNIIAIEKTTRAGLRETIVHALLYRAVCTMT